MLEKVPKIPNKKVVREYVDQPLDSELNELVTLLLGKLMEYQERARQKDPIKAKMRRRLVFGLREVNGDGMRLPVIGVLIGSLSCSHWVSFVQVKRGLKTKKIKTVIIAPNIDEGSSSGGLDDNVKGIIDTARENDAVVIFALNR
jgi:selenocysteine insertion sequence-binding protein 2